MGDLVATAASFPVSFAMLLSLTSSFLTSTTLVLLSHALWQPVVYVRTGTHTCGVACVTVLQAAGARDALLPNYLLQWLPPPFLSVRTLELGCGNPQGTYQ